MALDIAPAVVLGLASAVPVALGVATVVVVAALLRFFLFFFVMIFEFPLMQGK